FHRQLSISCRHRDDLRHSRRHCSTDRTRLRTFARELRFCFNDGFLRLRRFDLCGLADARRSGYAQSALSGLRSAHRRGAGLHLRAELHRALYVNSLCWLLQRFGRGPDQPADGDNLCRSEDAQVERLACVVAWGTHYRRAGRIRDGASQFHLAVKNGGCADSDLSLRHFDLRPTIPEDRTRGGGRLDRRNDQIGSDTDVPGVAVLYDDHSFDRTGAGTAYGISVAQQGRDVW